MRARGLEKFVCGLQGRRMWLRGAFFLIFNPITDQGEYYWLRILPEELKNAFLSPLFFPLQFQKTYQSARVSDYSAPALASYNTNECHTAWIEDSERKSCWGLIVFWISVKSKNTKYSRHTCSALGSQTSGSILKRSPFVLLVTLPESSSKVQMKTQWIFVALLSSDTKTLKTIMGKIDIYQFTAPMYSSLRGYFCVLCCISLWFSG